jgi:hypothetical protein
VPWEITLQPRDLRVKIQGKGLLQTLPDNTEQDEIAGAVETMAYIMERDGFVPQLEDWKGTKSMCRRVKRIHRFTYTFSVEVFEQEKEVGLGAGMGYLRARRV